MLSVAFNVVFNVVFMLTLMADPLANLAVQLRIDHVGAQDRPVPALVLYAAGSEKDFPLPAECPKAAVCIAVDPGSWSGLTASAESMLKPGTHPGGQAPLGSFRFRLLGADTRVDLTLYPPESGEALSRMEQAVTADAPRRELHRRAALGHGR
jgi:hypothetical protein